MVAGIWVIASSRQLMGPGLWLLVASTVVGWLALDSFGLFENPQMRKALLEILEKRGEAPLAGSPFVGFATPRYHGLLDAHEDVGFLQILPHKLLFTSETRTIELQHHEAKKVCFRWNVHTILILGGWVSVEGISGGKPVRLLVEPRDRPTMLGNLRESRKLRARLATWISSKPAP